MLQPPNIDLAQERECVPRTAVSGGCDLQQTPPKLDSRCRFQGVGVAIRRSSSLDETELLESLFQHVIRPPVRPIFDGEVQSGKYRIQRTERRDSFDDHEVSFGWAGNVDKSEDLRLELVIGLGQRSDPICRQFEQVVVMR